MAFGRHAVMFIAAAQAVAAAPSGAAPDGIPRPEHPRPDGVRAEWLNLNGEWEFAETDEDVSFPGGVSYPDRIVVPFCRESALSGLQRKGFVKHVWYRRTFAIPVEWKSRRVRLHVGACDWRTWVWVNDILVGEHVGGSAPFVFEVTRALKPGENTVVVHAFDDTRSGLQACGKQSQREESYGCLYTRTTGIWQTVWLEGVGDSYVRAFALTPDPDNARVLINAEIDGPSDGLTLEAAAFHAGKAVSAARVAADWRHTCVALNLSEKHLWSVEDPFLYDLKLTLRRGDEVVDTLDSYFGLRRVSIEGAAMLLNGKAVFQRLVLDQGFYPEGVWTAPTDAALKRDIELSQAVGFNGARLHQKVFEPRLLYWADRLGYLVWGEYPNWGLNVSNPAAYLAIVNEWLEVLERDRNHPSVIGWCPFNETPPEAGALQRTIVELTRAVDPTRPVIESSGYYHGHPEPQVLDAHDYDPDPVTLKARWDARFSELSLPERYGSGNASIPVPFFVSEYGGIGWQVGEGGWGYGEGPKNLDEFYARYQGLTDALLDNRHMFGFCYTQLTNIEQEQNGVYTYNREPKFDAERLRVINARRARYEIDPPVKTEAAPPVAWQVIVGAQPDGALAREWRYTTTSPKERWEETEFDDDGWLAGYGGFGKKSGWESRIRTLWDGKHIWLRQTFRGGLDGFKRALLVIHYDNAAQVYVNGKEVWKGTGWNDAYQGFDVSESLRAALRRDRNVVAIHCHQEDGGQYIDVALLVAE